MSLFGKPVPPMAVLKQRKQELESRMKKAQGVVNLAYQELCDVNFCVLLREKAPKAECTGEAQRG